MKLRLGILSPVWLMLPFRQIDVLRIRPLPPVLPQRIGEKRGLLETLPSIMGLNP